MAVLANLPVLGWAKPVPVNPARLSNPRRQMLWVGLAGPITNFSLMVAAAIPAKILLAGTSPNACTRADLVDPGISLTGNILASFAVVNMLLGLFNLLPIPPLDGASLIERVLPARYLQTYWKIRPYGFLILFVGLFYFNFFGRILAPFFDDLCRYLVR
jgi:Zn-dependent protease